MANLYFLVSSSVHLKSEVGSSFVPKWVKDPGLSLQQLRSLVVQVRSLAQELPQADSVVKRIKKK